MYRSKTPHYQAVMLNSLMQIWAGHHRRVLDVGGGTGVIAQAIAEFLPVSDVVSVDLVDRFCTTLSVQTQQYDGRTLPFASGDFDAATLNNVLHHVPTAARADLLREIRRTTRGPLYIKDHERRGVLDHWRLTVLDAIGNIPFGGMLWAHYLTRCEWENLAHETGYRIAERVSGGYRAAPYAWLFPDRLEITMRFDPI
jgi:SAM-dependent methyltransferase